MDSGEIVVSSIRAGMKREFAMMMKAQSEIVALPAGRRRMTRSQSTAGSSKGNVRSADKRREAEKVGAELREDMQRVRGTDGDSIQEADRPVGETTDLGMKMSEKVELNRIPTKLKDLLQTGLLEGLHVRYIHGSKGRSRPESELRLFRELAYYVLVMNARKESGNKRPPQYIFLDNGNSLRDVLNACKANLSESLESVILNAIGRSNYTTAFCINCKELIPEAGAGRSMLLCDACVLQKESDASDAQIGDASSRSPLAGPSTPASTSRPPVVSESAQISSDSQPQAKRQGKLTRKDLRMHKSVLAEDVLPEGTALSYVMRGEKKLEGYKKDGVSFARAVSPSQFEAHAGFASRRKPYMSIYTSNGVSLHQLSLELSKIRRSSTEEHDDLCSICEDGGDLLCCANCPRGFHTECVGLSAIPQGIWYCKYCQNMFGKEKFAEPDANAIAAGRVPGVNPLEAITQRCIRVVGTLEPEIGDVPFAGSLSTLLFPFSSLLSGNSIEIRFLRRHDFCKKGFSARTIIICDQCEKEYHVGCLKEHNIDDLKELPEEDWFCCTPCKNINSALRKLIGDGEQRLPEALSDVVKMKSEGQDLHKNPELGIRWRLLHGKKATEDSRLWLSGAVNIFHDRFDPISASSTGRLDLIPHMVYGRRFKDQDFCGMYCAVLMVGSVVVSAAIFRIFGEEVAELPLVATRSECQGKGYFQSLFYCVEGLLASLNVKDLVLPAADEAESLWRNRFGFQTLGQEQVAQCLPSTLRAFYRCN
ncbi:Increased DNA methylation 1 [Sesamum angolense]|uniref:Increased DNA methylation 1 n=1 Tax=Sesamum angolense TaxID=2727404 RepID=A0AAE1XBS2_9LAMI|nr:Increased DNA methylation 1 [Sesamum angolense]